MHTCLLYIAATACLISLFCICMLRLISSSACLYVCYRVNAHGYLSLLACLHEHACMHLQLVRTRLIKLLTY